MNKDNKRTEGDNTDKKLHISDVIPRYKYGIYFYECDTPEYDWFIIDTETDKIVEKLKNVSLSDVRLRCREWNNNVV